MSRLLDNKPTWVASLLIRLGHLIVALLGRTEAGRFFRDTRDSQVPIDFTRWFCQRVLGINAAAYWPMHPTSTVTYAKRIHAGIETSPGWSRGCYIQGINGIYIGDYTQIAPNVGIISGNHEPYDLSAHVSAPPIRIGRYCLLGMNSVILPGVQLGDYVIVGANSVVTHSYPDGYVVLGGSPARPVKHLDPSLRRDYQATHPYHGYISAAKFQQFKRRHLAAPEAVPKDEGPAS